MTQSIPDKLEQEFKNQRPLNPLLNYRSYSYHHLLFMCDSSSTAEELVEILRTDSSQANALQTQYAAQTAQGRQSTEDGTEGRLKETQSGKYVVVTNGTINSDYIITSLKWSSITAANIFPGDQYTSLACDGEFTVQEPRGIRFLNTLAESCKLLEIGAESAVFVLKTYFVGFTNDSQRDQIEILTDVKPLMFLMLDIVGTFTENGGAYDVQFVALSNGATRRPHVMRLENFHAQLSPSLSDSLKQLETYINEESFSYFSCVVDSTNRAFSGNNGEDVPPDVEVLSSTKLVQVKYEIYVDQEYTKPEYTVNNGQQAHKERGLCIEPINLKIGQVSIESAIRQIMDASVQVIVDRKGGENGQGDKYDYRIHSIMKSTSPKGSNGAPETVVIFFVTRFAVVGTDLIAKLTSVEPTSNQTQQPTTPNNVPSYDEIADLIRTNLVTYRYIYTGRNVDILNFDIKMQMGLAFFQIISQTNNIKEHLQSTPSQSVAGSTTHQIGTASSVYTPIFLGTNLRNPKGFNSTSPDSSITYNAALSRWASVEAIESKITIVGNPRFIGQLNQHPSDYADNSVTKKKFMRAGTSTEYISPNKRPTSSNVVGEQSQATLQNWGFFPALARVQVFMPKTPNDIQARKAAIDKDEPYSEEFWYNGYYYILGITNMFEDGKFTQELEMLSLPKNMADVNQKNGEVEFNKLLTECVNTKHSLPSSNKAPGAASSSTPQSPPNPTASPPAPTGPYISNYAAQPGDNKRVAENRELLKDPNIQAYLKTIRLGEGTKDEDGYYRHFGGKITRDVSSKPTEIISKGGHDSSAFGAYQIINKTEEGLKKQLGNLDFSPANQDVRAVELLRQRGAIDAIKRGDIAEAKRRTAPEWASIPTSSGKSYYGGQPAVSNVKFDEEFRRNQQPGSIIQTSMVPPGSTSQPTTPTQPANQSVNDVKNQAMGAPETPPADKSPCDKLVESKKGDAQDKTPAPIVNTKFAQYEQNISTIRSKVDDISKHYNPLKFAEQQKSVNALYNARNLHNEETKKKLVEQVSEYNTLIAEHKTSYEETRKAWTEVKKAAGNTSAVPETLSKQIAVAQEKVIKSAQKTEQLSQKLNKLNDEIQAVSGQSRVSLIPK